MGEGWEGEVDFDSWAFFVGSYLFLISKIKVEKERQGRVEGETKVYIMIHLE